MYNRNRIKPTKAEIIELQIFYKSLIILESKKDIIKFQNYTVEKIDYHSNGIGEINIINIIKSKKGLCFHRSLIMQKVMILNGINIRPVFLFSNPFSSNTGFFDFFSSKIHTHNIFEFCWHGKWYVMETNQKIFELKTLDQYLISQKLFKTKPRYIRYLNNRNSRFIKPYWMPDIY